MDVDGTLVAGTSCERLFIRHVAARGLLGPRQLAAFAAFPARWAHRFGPHVFKKNKAYLAGLAVADIEAVAREFVVHEIAPRLRPAMVAQIDHHRARGEPVALLTGTPDFIVAPLAEAVGADAFSGSVCAQSQGRFTAAPPRAHPFQAAKLAAAGALCARLGVRLADCAAYGDSRHDLPLLRAVRRAVAVAPESDLARAAAAAGWRVIDG